MTDRELMQMALDALEVSTDWDMGATGKQAQSIRAITALRAALAELEQEPRADAHLFYAPGDVLICKESGEKAKVINGNTGALQLANGKITLEWSDEVFGEYTLGQIMDGFIREAQPEPEPVAWMCKTGHGTFLRETINEEMANFTHGGKKAWEPLYTAPPQREWQGLTNEDRMQIWEATVKYVPGELRIKEFACSLESLLKEKNK